MCRGNYNHQKNVSMQTKRKKQKQQRWSMNSARFPISQASISLKNTKKEEAKAKWKRRIISSRNIKSIHVEKK